ncbi:MAG: FmdB family zinc ribbon protein [Tepidiformaceae bacterium]
MPLYEYFCDPCNGVFEELRPMREAADPVPCPQCYKDAPRIMPTSFAAFTFREGYPRRIPDDGKYYHLGKKVSTQVTGGMPNEHPEINKPEPKPRRSKGEKEVLRDLRAAARRGALSDQAGNAIEAAQVTRMYDKGEVMTPAAPSRG